MQYYYYSNNSSYFPINVTVDTAPWKRPVASSSYWTIMIRRTNHHHHQQQQRLRRHSSLDMSTSSTKSSSNTFPYQAHRYVRSRLVEDNPCDKYDLKRKSSGNACSGSATTTANWSGSGLLGTSSSGTSKSANATNSSSTASFLLLSSSSSFFREYWTNGRVTYLYSLPSAVGSSTKPQSRPLEKKKQEQLLEECQDHHDRPAANELTFFSTETDKNQVTVCNVNSNSNNASTQNTPHRPSSRDNNSDSSSSNVVRNSLIAGSAAGMASTIVCHPFDVLRVKMQSAGMMRSTISTAARSTSNAAAAAAANIAHHPGVLTTLKNTIQFGGGFRALYTGLMLPLAAQAVYKGTIFTVNNITETAILNHRNSKNKINPSTPVSRKQLTMADKFVSGVLGGAVNATLFCTPVEYVRNQQIAQIERHRPRKTTTTTTSRQSCHLISGRSGTTNPKRFGTTATMAGPISVIRRTLHEKGLRGLWKGAASTILRDSIGCGCFFVAMSCTQDALSASSKHGGQSSAAPSFSNTIISGAAAGVAYWLWALPVDTVKTWIQTGTCSNLRQAIQLAQHRGMSSLFRGYQVAYARGAPSAAITVTTYSFVYQCLE